MNKKKIVAFALLMIMWVQVKAVIAEDDLWSLSDDGTLTVSKSDITHGDRWSNYESQIKKIVCTKEVESIGDYAFEGYSALENVEMADNVKTIGEKAFQNCRRLKSVKLSGSLKSIEAYTFGSCSMLKEVTIPEGVTKIGNWSFDDCKSLESVTLPSTLTNIEFCAFYNCYELKNIVIPEGVTEISTRLFYGCTAMKSVTIPSSVTKIGENSFTGCKSLESLTIPEGVESIGEKAFMDCSGMKTLTVPSTLTSISQEAFANCKELESIQVASGNTTFDSREGCNAIIKTAEKSLILGCTNTTIPEGIKKIGTCAFKGSGVTTIELPSSVENLNGLSFGGCDRLVSIRVASDNKTFDSREDCNAIITKYYDRLIVGCKGTTIPESVTSIDNEAFAGCGIERVRIPSSVTKIGSYTFYECEGLTIVTDSEKPATKYYMAFPKSMTVYIPKGCTEKYKEAWGSDYTYIEVSEGSENTALGTVKKESIEKGVYNIGGRYVGNTTAGLRNGVYVVVSENGDTRKMIIK